MSAPELKPCPFCGGEAERITLEDDENFGGDVICCTKCQASSNVEFGFKENLVSNWNRRADLPPTDAEVMNHPKVRATVEAAATLGRIVGFLGDDEVRIAAFREACGSDLWCRAIAAIQEDKP